MSGSVGAIWEHSAFLGTESRAVQNTIISEPVVCVANLTHITASHRAHVCSPLGVQIETLAKPTGGLLIVSLGACEGAEGGSSRWRMLREELLAINGSWNIH